MKTAKTSITHDGLFAILNTERDQKEKIQKAQIEDDRDRILAYFSPYESLSTLSVRVALLFIANFLIVFPLFVAINILAWTNPHPIYKEPYLDDIRYGKDNCSQYDGCWGYGYERSSRFQYVLKSCRPLDLFCCAFPDDECLRCNSKNMSICSSFNDSTLYQWCECDEFVDDVTAWDVICNTALVIITIIGSLGLPFILRWIEKVIVVKIFQIKLKNFERQIKSLGKAINDVHVFKQYSLTIIIPLLVKSRLSEESRRKIIQNLPVSVLLQVERLVPEPFAAFIEGCLSDTQHDQLRAVKTVPPNVSELVLIIEKDPNLWFEVARLWTPTSENDAFFKLGIKLGFLRANATCAVLSQDERIIVEYNGKEQDIIVKRTRLLRYSYYRRMFDMLRVGQNCVHHADNDEEALGILAMLKFIRGDKDVITRESVIPLLMTSDAFDIRDFHATCCEYLLSHANDFEPSTLIPFFLEHVQFNRTVLEAFFEYADPFTQWRLRKLIEEQQPHLSTVITIDEDTPLL